VAGENKRTAPGSKRVTMTLTADEYERLTFWADRRQMSINEYLHECFSHMIDYENGVYDAPTIMQERMNLVVDAVTMNSSKLDSLANFITSGFESLLAAARGDDYLHTVDNDEPLPHETTYDDAFDLEENLNEEGDE
jgi:hypothetical protein